MSIPDHAIPGIAALAARKTLNDLTREEIADIRHAHEPATRHCAWCDVEKKMRPDQKFCSARCRVAFSHAGARHQHEAHLRAEVLWREERADFVREISELRAELAALKAAG